MSDTDLAFPRIAQLRDTATGVASEVISCGGMTKLEVGSLIVASGSKGSPDDIANHSIEVAKKILEKLK
jgi:hypothetical protein